MQHHPQVESKSRQLSLTFSQRLRGQLVPGSPQESLASGERSICGKGNISRSVNSNYARMVQALTCAQALSPLTRIVHTPTSLAARLLILEKNKKKNYLSHLEHLHGADHQRPLSFGIENCQSHHDGHLNQVQKVHQPKTSQV